MPDDRIKISALPSALSLNNTDVLAIVQGMTGDNKETKKVAVTLIAAHLLEVMQHNNLDTSDKTIIGAINEVAETLEGLYPVADASGPIANFETELARPLEALKAGIVATQASGTPTPSSPLPISGWSQITLFQRGNNLWNEQWEVGGIDNTTGVDAPSNNYFRSVGYIPVPVGENLYLYNGNSDTIGLRFYDRNKTFIGARAFLTSKVATYGTNDLPTDTAFIRIVNTSTNVYANNISINYPSSDTEYHAYNPNSQEVTIALGETYYGGYVTQDKAGHRQLVITYSGLLDMGDLSWANFSPDNNIFRAYTSNCKAPQTTAERLKGFLCSIYPASQNVSLNENMTDKSIMRYNGWIMLRDTSYSDYSELASGLSGAKLIYELDTPIIVDLPDGVPIETVIGVNNIFADSGDILECKYKDTIQHYIDTQIAATQALIL